MKYYHATLWDNYLSSINKEGLKIEKAIDRRIYLCKTPDDCKRFFEVRPYIWDKVITILTLELDESTVFESTDHIEKYFGCKAYYTDKDVPPEFIKRFFNYEYPEERKQIAKSMKNESILQVGNSGCL